MTSLRTLNDVFLSIVARNQTHVMMHRQAGAWVSISAEELYQDVCATARALLHWGILKGDRIAILSENRPEWTIADFAALLIGAITVPVYSTSTDQQTAYILGDSGARIIFVSSENQLKKVTAVQDQTKLVRIVVMDPIESARAIQMHHIIGQGPRKQDRELEVRARAISPDDPASIIYTSGTTGTPKGAVLTHGNLASNISSSLAGFDMGPGDISISFLPLSHVTARHVDFSFLCHGVSLAYCPFLDQLPLALQEIKPTIFVGVPRVYEKIYGQAVQKPKSALKNAIYNWALSVGRHYKGEILAGRKPGALSWKIADRLVFSKVRQAMGGRVRIFISGGAPLGREVAEWFALVGIRIHEGYGLTETSPVIAVNNPQAHRLFSVGKPLSNLLLRIAEDGELLVRGPSVFSEYWNRPDETQAAFTDGWFRTGDIGHLDEDGFLYITDRKKDLIKTSGGKFIAPQPLENSLKHNPLVAEAVVLGDRRRFPAVLIVPDFATLEAWARKNQIAFSSRQELVSHPRVQELYEGIVGELNQILARFEKLKKVVVIAEEFSTENGTLTASMKLRRRVVEQRYLTQIEAIYERAEPENVSTKVDSATSTLG